MVLRHGLKLVVAGLLIGIAGALGLTRLMTNWLYGVQDGVQATDPVTFIAVPGLIILIGSAACLDARRSNQLAPLRLTHSQLSKVVISPEINILQPSIRPARTPRKRNSRVKGPFPFMPTREQINANRANGRGRDAGCPAPPAQIRTCGSPAYGSYLG
jgi:hypothetical protein